MLQKLEFPLKPSRRFLQEATAHLIRLTNSHVDAVACDLHPKFTTTNLAREIAQQNGWQLVQVQHHHAHVAALMAEHDVDEIVGVACDGYGYGVDGEAWGGEILFCSRNLQGFRRLGHLEQQPLLGGDVATRYPLRLAAGILGKEMDVAPWLLENARHLPHGETEAELILSRLRKPQGIPRTTSLGRVLDAAAAVLGICHERTFEGEAAMKLESAAVHGTDALGMEPVIRGDTLDTTQLLLSVFYNRGAVSAADLAYSVHAYLARGLAIIAAEKAVEQGVGTVGFTGGSAVNTILPKLMRDVVESRDLRFLVHEAVPSGDGGISFGQAFVGGFWDS